MTDEIKNETEVTELASTQPEPEKKPRGNPAWRKKMEDKVQEPPKIKRAEVVEETVVSDMWEVKNKEPKMHYCWARKSRDEEISRMIQDGYVPARGKEQIMRNPLESNKDGDGETKERGDRILMVCPQDRLEARRRERASRYVNSEKAGKADARSMQSKGVRVESVSESETKRESLTE